jgi:hypothetical protein
LGDTLNTLKQERPVHVGYETRFLIDWPDHFGGTETFIDLEGTMVLRPLLGIT